MKALSNELTIRDRNGSTMETVQLIHIFEGYLGKIT
jgi:hypothetical protein